MKKQNIHSQNNIQNNTFTDDSNFEMKTSKLSPFQRPLLPPSYYPFGKKKSLKTLRIHTRSNHLHLVLQQICRRWQRSS